MNIYLCIAGILFFVLGLAHSLLGEYLIFKDKRNEGSLVPSKDSTGLKERHLRIIWATWHLSSVLGWCMGYVLIIISLEQIELDSTITDFIVQSIMYATFTSSLLVLIGTKGKHPGWIGFLLIGVLLLIGTL